MNREQMVEKAARAMLEDDLAADRAADDWDHGADRAWLVSNARAVLDAILPQVTTVAELESLPVGSVVIDVRGETWKDRTNIDGLWYGTDLDEITVSRLSAYSPLTVVWQPEVTR